MSYGRQQQYGSYDGRYGARNYPPRRPWENMKEENNKEAPQYQHQRPQANHWGHNNSSRPSHQTRNNEHPPKEKEEEKATATYGYKPQSRHCNGASGSASTDNYYRTGGADKTKLEEDGKRESNSHSNSNDSKASKDKHREEQDVYPRSRPTLAHQAYQPYNNVDEEDEDDEEEETGEDLVNQLLTLSPRGRHVIPRKAGEPRNGNTKIVVEDLHVFMGDNEIETFQWNNNRRDRGKGSNAK